jgi:hypothetical protein
VRAEPVADAAAAADPLFLLPARYEDRTRITPVGALRAGTRAVVEGEVQLADVVYRRRRSLLVKISDGSGFLTLRFFHFSRSQQQNLARGTHLRCFGEARRGPQGLEMVHPEYRRIGAAAEPLEEVAELRQRVRALHAVVAAVRDRGAQQPLGVLERAHLDARGGGHPQDLGLVVDVRKDHVELLARGALLAGAREDHRARDQRARAAAARRQPVRERERLVHEARLRRGDREPVEPRLDRQQLAEASEIVGAVRHVEELAGQRQLLGAQRAQRRGIECARALRAA